MKKENGNNKGFSLVELIVVIAIMAVLIGVLGPQFMKYVEKSRQSTDIQTADNVATVLKTYYTDHTAKDVTITLSKSADPSGDTDKALEDAKMHTARLKSDNWTIQVKYEAATGKVTYSTASAKTGAVLYYTATDASEFTPE